MKSSRFFPAACASAMLLFVASGAMAQLSGDDRKCLDAVYNGSRKVHQQEAKGNRKNCIKGMTGNQDACINGDQAKSTDQGNKLTAKYGDKCAVLPAFGVNANVATIINAAQDASDNVHRNKWGSPVDPDNTDKCHDKISKRSGDLSTAQWKTFRGCVKDLAAVNSIADIETCIGSGLAQGLADKGGKITDEVGGAKNKCQDPLPNFDDGDCGDTPLPAVASCILDNVSCETCNALNTVTGGNFNCSTYCPAAHKCTFDEVVDNSDLDLRVQGNVSLGALVGNISGAIDINCPPPSDVNGKRACDCTFQTWTPVSVTGIGVVCIDPGVCSPGEIDCDGGNTLNIDAIDDPDIGLCTSNADCSSQCDTFCAGIAKVQWRSGCERFCQGGIRNDLPCICDAVGTGGCVGGTAGVDDCPGGSCVGKQNELDSDCQCQCIDYSFGAASPAGTISCNIGTDLKVVASLPCTNPALVDLPPVCGALTSASTTGFTDNANADDGGGNTIGPNTRTGLPETCANLDLSTTTGFDLNTDIGFFDSALGDLRALLRLDCQ